MRKVTMILEVEDLGVPVSVIQDSVEALLRGARGWYRGLRVVHANEGEGVEYVSVARIDKED